MRENQELKIKKFELVYFHSKNRGNDNGSVDEESHRHIYSEVANECIGQTNTSENYDNHRELIRKFLKSIRNIFDMQFHGKSFAYKDEQSVAKEVGFTLDPLKHKGGPHDFIITEPGKESVKAALVKLLGDIRDRVEYTGSSHVDGELISNFLNKMLDATPDVSHKLDMGVALDLLSLIKVEKGWDVFRILFNKMYGSNKQFPNVLYVNYNIKNKCEGGCSCHTCKHLGYKFEITILGEEQVDSEPSDYFEVINKTNGNAKKDTFEDSHVSYLLLINSLRKFIYGTSNGNDTNITFVYYPIYYLNSIHYIQIHVENGVNSNGPKEQISDLKNLREKWSPLHEKLNIPFFRHLTLSIEQINSFSFQHYVRYYINEKDKDDKDINPLMNEDIAYKVFSNNIGCLLPAQNVFDKYKKEHELPDWKGESIDKANDVVRKALGNLRKEYIIPIYDKEAEEKLFIKLEHSDYYEENKDFVFEQAAFLIENHWNWVLGRVDRLRKILRASKKSELASIMARNMSHNIGSHVLSSQNVYDDIEKNKEPLKRFHSYLQTRMDFITRITGDKPSWSEPILFVGELLNGFFRQTILLNNLVSDQGPWKEEKIKFIVKLPDNGSGSKVITFEYKNTEGSTEQQNAKKEKTWLPDEHEYDDFLVSVPEGIIGAHAFYIFMEGMMRNSAKYGKNDKEPGDDDFIINIEIENPQKNGSGGSRENYYILKISDTLSNCQGQLSKDIQGKIKDYIVDNFGDRTKGLGLGITEMHEACKFLIYPFEKEFPVREENKRTYNLWAKCKEKEYDICEPDYNNGHCDEKECKSQKLIYSFNLAKPQMVGIVNTDKSKTYEAKQFGIERIEEKVLLGEKGAAFLFVIFSINSETDKTDCLKFIKENHRKLPQRLLLSVDNSNIKCNEDEIIPKRRAVLSNNVGIMIDELLNGNKENNYEGFIIKIYETWIMKRWPNEEIKLCVSFQRDKYPINWGNILKSDISRDWAKLQVIYGNKNVQYYIDNSLEDGKERIWCEDPFSDSTAKEIWYDNHGFITKGINKDFFNSTGSIEGSNNRKIYETLSTPPNSKFVFDYFLLGLIEAGLTKVVILDERVASEAIGSKQKVRKETLFGLERALCYPIFMCSSGSKEPKPLTAALEGYQGYCHKDTYTTLKYADKEFAVVRENKGSLEDIDFAIFHTGIIETRFKEVFEGNNDSNTNDSNNLFNSLYTLCPSVILTSGSGNIIRVNMPKDLPFSEFSCIYNNTIRTLSKYHLVRTLMSIKGK